MSRTALITMKLPSMPALGAALLLATFALHGAQAQTKAEKVVTRDELRACMNSESDLAARRKALETRAGKNNEEAAAIRAEGEELATEKKKLEDDQKPMDRFERKIKAYNARVAGAKAAAETLRTDVEALNEALVAHNGKCGGISYLPEDKEAILKERAAAGK